MDGTLLVQHLPTWGPWCEVERGTGVGVAGWVPATGLTGEVLVAAVSDLNLPRSLATQNQDKGALNVRKLWTVVRVGVASVNMVVLQVVLVGAWQGQEEASQELEGGLAAMVPMGRCHD